MYVHVFLISRRWARCWVTALLAEDRWGKEVLLCQSMLLLSGERSPLSSAGLCCLQGTTPAASRIQTEIKPWTLLSIPHRGNRAVEGDQGPVLLRAAGRQAHDSSGWCNPPSGRASAQGSAAGYHIHASVQAQISVRQESSAHHSYCLRANPLWGKWKAKPGALAPEGSLQP